MPILFSDFGLNICCASLHKSINLLSSSVNFKWIGALHETLCDLQGNFYHRAGVLGRPLRAKEDLKTDTQRPNKHHRVSVYFGTDQGPKMKGWQVGFCPQAAI